MKVAKEGICDIYNNVGKYIECQYYEKIAEKKDLPNTNY